nr:hypothetical protein B0A51_03582 [Rachicladosporium sp. CCFEE 5018]
MASPPCHLLALPPELRLRIYEALLPPGHCYFRIYPAVYIHREADRLVPRAAGLEQSVRDVALLRTCRQVHAEATPVLYDHTIFDIMFGTPFAHFKMNPIFCSLEEFTLGGPVRSVYNKAPFRRGITEDEDAEACNWIVDKVLKQLDDCASARRVHIEDLSGLRPDGEFNFPRHALSLQRLEKLRCQGEVTISLILLDDTFDEGTLSADACAVFAKLVNHLRATVQRCTWHRQL